MERIIYANWSLATFHASYGKQLKWVDCKVHKKSLTNDRIPRTTPRTLPIPSGWLLVAWAKLDQRIIDTFK